MKQESKSILLCPSCKVEINVQEALYQQLDAEIRNQQQIEFAHTQKDFDEKLSELKMQSKIIENQKVEIQDSIEKGVFKQLGAEKAKLEKKLREQIVEEKSEELKSLQEQLDEKVQEAKDLNKIRADYQKQLRLNLELEGKVRAEAEEAFSKKLYDEKKKFQKDIEDKVQFKISEKEFIIQQLKDQLTIAQRKAEQGSMQIQGEVQELAIEDFLRSSFPLDTIIEVKKGSRGADCAQVVNSRTQKNCGSIYYESKRTKEFQMLSPIEKFKKDMRENSATFGVLITDVYPKNIERLGQLNGIWICSYSEFKSLVFVLREAILLLSDAVNAQENKGGKMEMLYEFLISKEFKHEIEAIVEATSQMHTDLESERRAMESIWKKRQNQIRKVALNMTNFYGTVKGIAGNTIGNVKLLELPDINNEN